jgi:hypothetical protein
MADGLYNAFIFAGRKRYIESFLLFFTQPKMERHIAFSCFKKSSYKIYNNQTISDITTLKSQVGHP